MNNRLQFRHHTPIFETREEAIEYIYTQIRYADEGLSFEDKSYGFSLLAEPTILRYKNEIDETDPHVIIAIGATTNEGTQYNDNRFCIIDIDKTEKEIADLWEELEDAIKSLSIITKDTNTLKLYSEKTDEGTVISGDVIVAESQIFDDVRKPNIILNTDDGLFTYVNMEYNKDNDIIKFTVNGTVKEWELNNLYVVNGYYSKRDESLHLLRNDETEIKISLENLINEWDVEGDASNTPVVLTREKVGYGDEANHNHVEPWQDVLKGDVRLSDRKYNILKKTTDGRCLYVDGLASNITYFRDGEEIDVQTAISEVSNGASNDVTNIIYEKSDGYYATASLKYLNKQNKLVFTTSNVTGGTTSEEIQLNAVEAFKNITYNSVTETLVIIYVDGNGDVQECDVPIGEMMTDWEWDIVNDGHNVKLHKQRVIAGNDKVSADVDIAVGNNNILEDVNHQLYVKGTADNIKYGRDGNVEDELDKLNANDADINARLNETSGKVDTLREEFDAEVVRATSEEQRIETKLDEEISRSTEKDTEHDSEIETINTVIGSGFTTDTHETVTYKFEQLTDRVATEETRALNAETELNNKIEAETQRATDAEEALATAISDEAEAREAADTVQVGRLDAIDAEIGVGFGPRNTVRDEIDRLQGEIDSVSADSASSIKDVINNDHSINVDKTDSTKPVISVNLSEEVEDERYNIIKLNNDGLFANVDLSYEEAANKLIFHTSNGQPDKVIQLDSVSSIIDMHYDPNKEAIIVTYMTNGHEVKTLEIPVGDLIREWEPSDSTNGAIKLTLTLAPSGSTDKDILYAETIISTHEDNILINDGGALYVSGAQIEQNKQDIANINNRIVDIESGLTAEINRSIAKDDEHDREISSLRTDLTAEVTRSTAKDSDHDNAILSLRTDLTAEVNRAKDAERDLHDEILAEENARISSDTAIRTDLNTEISRSTAKDSEHDAAISNLDNEVDGLLDDNVLIKQALSAETIARISGDTILENKIESANTRAINEEARIENKINQEISRSTAKDTEHDNAISSLRTDLNTEVTRATNAENDLSNVDSELRGLIHNEEDRAKTAESALTHSLEVETIARENADNLLDQKIISANNEISRLSGQTSTLSSEISTVSNNLATEVSRASLAESTLDSKIDSANTRAINAETILSTAINNETAAREAADANILAKIRPIEFNDSTTVKVERVRNSGENPDEVTNSIIISQAEDNIITANTTLGGVYATAKLGYNESANLLTIYGPNDHVINSVTLGPGSIIKDISYDYAEKDLVVTYRRAGADEDRIMKFPVADLFNEWVVDNKSEGVALELFKESGASETGTVDKIWGRVLVNHDHADNLLIIDSNGLYVSGSGITKNNENIECLVNKTRAFETAVMGTPVEGCGEGYSYTKNPSACFISAATSLYNADLILDNKLCQVSSDVECINSETKNVETVLGVTGNCGAVISYPITQGCLLSTASTYAEADSIMEAAICNLNEVINGNSETPTVSLTVVDEGSDKGIKADVRLSHGKSLRMEDEDLTIDALDDSEFSDTNVLRAVEVSGFAAESEVNGLYLSNVWDCGQYTENGTGTPDEKYRTDDSPSAMNKFANKYRNGVRYQNG